MELWEALEVLAGRMLNFTTDVIILNNGDGDYDEDDIKWLIEDVEKPSAQEIEDMMELPPLLKIKHNPQGFIGEIKRSVEYIAPSNDGTIVVLNHVRPAEPYLDIKTGLPLYRLVNGAIIPVADPVEYKISECLWSRYSSAYIEEIHALIPVKTNEEMREIYVQSPEYKRELIFTAIQYYWTDKIPQFNASLTVEVLLRLLVEKVYIETIEQRPFTADELLSFNHIISTIRQSNTMLKNIPNEEGSNLDMTHWYNAFIPTMTSMSILLRNYEYAQRSFVCAPVPE